MILDACVRPRSSSIGSTSATAQECGWTNISMTLRVGALRLPNPSWMHQLEQSSQLLPPYQAYPILLPRVPGNLWTVICSYEAQQSRRACLMDLDGLKRVVLRHPAHPIIMGHESLHGWLLSASAHTSHVVPRSKRRAEANFVGVRAH